MIESPVLDSTLGKWCQENLKMDVNSETDLKELYALYKRDLVKSKTIPLSPKTFVSRLKQNYFHEIRNTQLKFYYKAGSKVIGLTIKNLEELEGTGYNLSN